MLFPSPLFRLCLQRLCKENLGETESSDRRESNLPLLPEINGHWKQYKTISYVVLRLNEKERLYHRQRSCRGLYDADSNDWGAGCDICI
jgi:hypothetical protein